MEYYIGRQVQVLVEEVIRLEGREYYIGHTREYVKVAFLVDQAGENMENFLVEVQVRGMLKIDTLLGEI